MLAQLLRKHRLGTQVAPHRAVSRSAIMGLDVSNVRMVCISYLDISGTPAHLRYLLRRLRQRVPDAPILVGLWPTDEAILKDEKLRAVVGADYYVASLREAVICCLKAANSDEKSKGAKSVSVPPATTERRSEKAPLPA
jgi:hypothetical protein